MPKIEANINDAEQPIEAYSEQGQTDKAQSAIDAKAREAELLFYINNTFPKGIISEEHHQLSKLPKVEGAEKLKGKNILIVDDIAPMLWAYGSRLAVATDGHAQVYQYRPGQTKEELASEIINRHPDVVLIDAHLQSEVGDKVVDLPGYEVCDLLRSTGIKCVGFVSGKDDRGFAERNIPVMSKNFPEQALQTLNELI